ncbi:MAG: hypothetical protein JF597_03155 [Streptomyces sp.]|uniref:hypothetical protein n=1 Tax=Streptomyces sp. TaxID=1931 RepID=UPI0025EFB1F9|nr:hypothetical protein [Streptomyces sp.]MBW8792610.1 hypothetical protein [Streptomyces sp.]
MLAVLGAVLITEVIVSPATGAEASLANGLGVVVGGCLIGVAAMLLTFGLVARGRGLMVPVVGVVVHSCVALTVIGGGGGYAALEVFVAEFVLLFSFFVGLPWWRSTALFDEPARRGET